jgi:hypothetical protein
MVAHFDADAVLLDGVGGFDRDLVLGLVAVLDAEVVVLDRKVEIGKDQFVLDRLPDNAGHFIAIEIDDGLATLILDMLENSLESCAAYSMKRLGGKGRSTP